MAAAMALTALSILALVNGDIVPDGKNSINPDRVRIVGGQTADPHEYPWQVSLQNSGRHHCGGSVINSLFVVTAAHCVVDFTATQITVVAGEHSLSTVEGTEQTKRVSRIISHESYDPNTMTNDIALLQLASELDLDGSIVNSIPIPRGTVNASGDAIVTGWGTTTEGGAPSDVLQEVTVPIISDEECSNHYGFGMIYSSMLCAGVPEGGKDPCQGDDGGPLIATEDGSEYYLAGIVFWGYGCGRIGYPGIYTEVAKFNDWINANAVL